MEELKAVPWPLPGITRHGLSVLLEVLGLDYPAWKSPALRDTVIIAIDFEGTNTIRSGFALEDNSQVGFAILDTKDLRQSHIPEDRNVIFVGHGIVNELHVLRALGFKFELPPSGMLDTSRIASEVFGRWRGSLGDLLGALGCPFGRLHVAGNDANFTLRALLLLAEKWCISQNKYDELLDILHDISTFPSYVDPKIEAATKREKRLLKSRKHQSKSWSTEKQDQIRAARETRRLEAWSMF
ncbi:hypothetical protein LX32DRAFT_655228 [Colletotrichum zoysiae]|uniref:Gfd2/YDR514C-like C-terminal domain-containing protein n=1 Tax=Colletotrichum zoysiae TaxID=1216348 RepID=A0AAD9HCD6_9PEZI|nr:hypothetical protein LX32DRAFT_655228 [Colletotrichum zoysiae]